MNKGKSRRAYSHLHSHFLELARVLLCKPAARMGGDSNPRYLAVNTLSRRAHSTTLPPILLLRGGNSARKGALCKWIKGETANGEWPRANCRWRHSGRGRRFQALNVWLRRFALVSDREPAACVVLQDDRLVQVAAKTPQREWSRSSGCHWPKEVRFSACPWRAAWGCRGRAWRAG